MESKKMKINKLENLIMDLDENKKIVADILLEELKFMDSTLETLKAQVREEGPVELFKQGKQKFNREHPALQAYNKTLQRYNQTIRQLLDLIPKDQPDTKDDLLEFIREG